LVPSTGVAASSFNALSVEDSLRANVSSGNIQLDQTPSAHQGKEE